MKSIGILDSDQWNGKTAILPSFPFPFVIERTNKPVNSDQQFPTLPSLPFPSRKREMVFYLITHDRAVHG